MSEEKYMNRYMVYRRVPHNSIHVSYTGKVTDEFNDFATNAATSAGKSIIAILEKLLLKTYARSFR